MSAQQPQMQMNIPMAAVADVCFNLNAIIGLDFSQYQTGEMGRSFTIYLLGPTVLVFENERADKAYMWYLQFTGQARIQAADAISAPGVRTPQ